MGTVMSMVPSTDVSQSTFTLALACQLRIDDMVASRLRNQIRWAPFGPAAGCEAISSRKTTSPGT